LRISATLVGVLEVAPLFNDQTNRTELQPNKGCTRQAMPRSPEVLELIGHVLTDLGTIGRTRESVTGG